jgi:hypothetical protein
VKQFQPSDSEKLPPHPEPGIQQNAEDSTLNGGMQAVIGDKNNQNQVSSSSNGNVVNVNVYGDFQAQTSNSAKLLKPTSGCVFKLAIGSFVISIIIGNLMFFETVKSPNLPIGTPMPTYSVLPNSDQEISGTWLDPNLGQYSMITQNGNRFQLETVGTASTGEKFQSKGIGTIDGRNLQYDYTAKYQSGSSSQGKCSGTVSANQMHIILMCNDQILGKFVSSVVRK